MTSVHRIFVLAGLGLTIITGVAFAEVERIEITSRSVFADGKIFGEVGAYEKIRGRLFYAVDSYPFWKLETEGEIEGGAVPEGPYF